MLSMMRGARVALVMGLLALGFAVEAPAQTVGPNCTIRWNANAEVDLLSYRVYGGLQPPAPAPLIAKTLDVAKPPQGGPTVSTTCAALGLTTGGVLSVQVDAVDTLGNRSPRSVIVTSNQDISSPAQPTGLVITPNP